MIIGYIKDLEDTDKKLNQIGCTYSITEGGYYLGDYIICTNKGTYQGNIIHHGVSTNESLELLEDRLISLRIKYELQEDYITNEFELDKPTKTDMNKGYRNHLKRKHKAKRFRIIKQNQNGYNPLIGWSNTKRINGYDREKLNQYVMLPKNSNNQKFLKRQTSKKIRKSKLEGKGNSYRKFIDYWWELL